jgi:hypothetical protein
MQIRKKYLSAILVMAIACNNITGKVEDTVSVEKTDTLNATAPVNPGDTTIGGCYTQLFKKDTVNLQIDIKGNNATGPLTYKLYQKDMNDGSIKAEVTDSIITGWYLFRSEGILSIRQVAWRIKPGQLWPAVGEVIQRNDTTVFADPASLKYDGARPFVKIKCIL